MNVDTVSQLVPNLAILLAPNSNRFVGYEEIQKKYERSP